MNLNEQGRLGNVIGVIGVGVVIDGSISLTRIGHIYCETVAKGTTCSCVRKPSLEGKVVDSCLCNVNCID